MQYNKLLQNIKPHIQRASLVSFDIFDTLLLRPYIKPTDLFVHLEKLENKEGFAKARIKAEIDARHANHPREDIIFDAIYEKIDPIFKSLKEKEIALEMQVLRPNPETVDIWNYAQKQEKKIIVVSDMYLPTHTIASLLKKNGFEGYDKLYVSGDIGKTKGHGSLYAHIQEDLGIQAKKILHIGDNEHSDHKQAQNYGIKTVLYKQVIEQYLDSDKRMQHYKEIIGDDLGASIMISMLAWHWQKKRLNIMQTSYWEDIGYTLAGPTIYGYTQWIAHQAKIRGIEKLLFVARDGYTLEKVFKIFNTGIKTNYIYASRIFNTIYRLDSKEDIENLIAIIDYYSKKSNEIKKAAENITFTVETAQAFIEQHRKLLQALANSEFKHYKKYLENAVATSNAIGVVDIAAETFSAQKLINHALDTKKNVHTFYWTVFPSLNMQPYKDEQDYSRFSKHQLELKYPGLWDLLEFLITAPEYPIKGITETGEPIYDTSSPHEQPRINVYQKISKQAEQFANDVHEVFGSMDIYLTSKTIITYINTFDSTLSVADIKNFSTIYHAKTGVHTHYSPIFPNITKQPTTKNKNVIKKILGILAQPIVIKRKGLKQLQIYILPRLNLQYIAFVLNITKTIYYKIVIGSKHEK